MDVPNESRISDWVIYKNNQFIAFNKPPGLPVQSDKTGDKALQDLASAYTHAKLHLVHRLDRPAGGVALFAKTEKALQAINEQFREREIEKTYLAVVGTKPEQDEGVLVHFVSKNGRTNKTTISTEEVPNSKRAELSYRLLGSSDRYHLLEIRLLTGRHHQIRAQLASIGCPIKGDVKYGFRRSNRNRSIHLHAWKLKFRHPVSGDFETLQATPPADDPVWAAFASFLA